MCVIVFRFEILISYHIVDLPVFVRFYSDIFKSNLYESRIKRKIRYMKSQYKTGSNFHPI